MLFLNQRRDKPIQIQRRGRRKHRASSVRSHTQIVDSVKYIQRGSAAGACHGPACQRIHELHIYSPAAQSHPVPGVGQKASRFHSFHQSVRNGSGLLVSGVESIPVFSQSCPYLIDDVRVYLLHRVIWIFQRQKCLLSILFHCITCDLTCCRHRNQSDKQKNVQQNSKNNTC